jgi:glycosyltransferase involved in cell wall biosynthesis
MGTKLSVVIPSYNRAHLVVRAVETVLAQTCSPDEIIVVDDGSTDDTADAMSAFINAKARHSPEIRYFVQQQKGPSAARNKGIGEARGDWIAFLDSDDLWHPEKLERQFKAIDCFQGLCGACYTDVRFTNNPFIELTAFSPLKSHYTDPVGVLSNPWRFIVGSGHTIFVQSLLARTEIIKAVGGFDENLFLGEDQDFTFRLSLLTGFCYVNMQLVEVDRSPCRETGMIELFENAAIRLEQRQLRNEKWLALSEDQEIKKILAKSLCTIHSEWANLSLAKGEYERAFRSIDEAVRYHWNFRTYCKRLLIRFAPHVVQQMVVWRGKAKEAIS